jgi:hypothetical protein
MAQAGPLGSAFSLRARDAGRILAVALTRNGP